MFSIYIWNNLLNSMVSVEASASLNLEHAWKDVASIEGYFLYFRFGVDILAILSK